MATLDTPQSFKKEAEKILKAYADIDETELGEDRFIGHHDEDQALTSIINLVDKEVIGEDENSKVMEQSSFSPSPTIDEHYRNNLRAEQRAIIRSDDAY